jgi:outer membrane protein insertion porin family
VRRPRHLRPRAVWRACAWAGVLALACALPSRAEEPPKPEEGAQGQPEGQGPIVREIDVRGNPRVDTGTVLRLIRTRVGRPFERRVWDDDWHRLTESGYFLNVRTTPPVDYPGGCKLVIDLVEMATVKKVEFKGGKSISPSDLRTVIQTTEGGRYQMGQVHLDARAIEKHYHEKAFRDATCTYEVTTVASHRQRVADQEQEVQDEVVVTFQLNEGNPIAVRTVAFVGNKAFNEAQLLGAIQTKPRRFLRVGDLKDLELDTDKKRLEHFYLRQGYMDVSIDETKVDVSTETYWNWWRKRKKLADVTFTITEGPLYHTGKVDISGCQNVELSEIKAVMKVKPGAVFSDLLLSDDCERIRKLYGEYGRVFTHVERERKLVTDPERLKDKKDLFDVELRIVEGSEVSLREVITRGNTKTRDKVIIRELELFPGDRLDTSRIDLAKQRLRNLNFFEDDVRISTEATGNPEEANVVIDVTEKPTGEFNFGVGVSSVDSLMGNISLTQRNFDYRDFPKSWRDFLSGNAFTGAGERFSIEATGGASRQRYSVSFYEPWAFDRPIRMGGSIFHTVDKNYEDFDETSTGFSVTAGKRLWGPRWDGDVTYRFSYTEIGGTDPNLPPIFQRQTGERWLSSITPRIVYDSRDSYLLPSRGWMMEASVELGGGPFGGSTNWFRPSLDVSRYFTLVKLPNGGKHILELRGTASMVENYLDTNEVSPYLRYFAGGIGTIRGFENRTMAPLESGYLVGGTRMVTATAEYSVPLYEEIVRGSVFVDAADVWGAGKADPGYVLTNKSGWRASVGLGLSIRTPLSPMPLRIYVSRAILKNDQDRTKTVDFTFGTRF